MPWILAVPYALASAVLVTYGLQLLVMGVGALRRRAPAAEPNEPGVWPTVTVQLPVFEEPDVIERLINSVCALDYPTDRLEIQVLDDSPPGVAFDRASRSVARWRSEGMRIEHVRRAVREGFKAGALAHGLLHTRSEYLCIFDADFTPAPDFLRRTVPWLVDDPSLGLVQARWAHLNESRSLLTRVQAALLDAHFVVEQGERDAVGLLMSFNGTAGVWRRDCIEDAGGWSADTLTEDLDLSYRAQLAGWGMRYLPSVAAPGELPPTAAALRGQQSRWAKGTAETAMKLGRRVVGAHLPRRLSAGAVLHLGSFLVHPSLVVVALLHAPLRLLTASSVPAGFAWAVAAGLGAVALSGVAVAHVAAARAVGVPRTGRLALFPAILAIAAGLAIRNTRGVVEAVWRRRTPFMRTPKSGAAWRAARESWTAEIALGLAAAVGAGALAVSGHAAAAAFQAIFAAGALWLALHDRVARSIQNARGAMAASASVARPAPAG